MSRHGGWQAQRSSIGAWATSLETAVAPIQHRRESACSLDVGLVPAALQRVVGLTSRLVRSLGSGEVEGSRGPPPAADGRSRRHWYRGGCLRRIGRFSQTYTTYRWTTPVLSIYHHRESKCERAERESLVRCDTTPNQRYQTEFRNTVTNLLSR